MFCGLLRSYDLHPCPCDLGVTRSGETDGKTENLKCAHNDRVSKPLGSCWWALLRRIVFAKQPNGSQADDKARSPHSETGEQFAGSLNTSGVL
ncbi:hypothetical protein T265_12146 [Opisthorchis viverrini]|uniref:Uncharacterized protein n=1 Tax=Opisthorchis viverrini TaxID=6198 RepID=A0A074YVK9_OPIVI|nr:hypothetical protein T265_12146 [Opisthorchis viverrini]KER18806.1 hypothetical protein T265_12146 [Opisthorchis viverrini]